MQASEAITRKSASNLALAFVLLPAPRRQGMSALYAFCREVDDVADEDALPEAVRRERLAYWRADVRRACEGGEPELPVNRELVPVIARHRLPFALFDELLQGVEMDLGTLRYETYEQLETYCYRVASVVGLLSIEIFGYRHPGSRQYAVYLGKALQFTNILRDVANDADRGRVYLPAEELARAGLTAEDVLARRYDARFLAVVRAVASRARAFYELARASLPEIDRRSMVAAELMGTVYWRLLERLDEERFRVFEGAPVRVSRLEKLRLVARTWWRDRIGSRAPNYGGP